MNPSATSDPEPASVGSVPDAAATLPCSEVIARDCISVAAADLEAHARDSWPAAAKWDARELQAHLPLCVVRPRTTADVTAIVEFARRNSLALVPYGAGSGVTGAAVPNSGAISLDTRALNRIIEIDEDNWLATAEAGVMGGDLEKELNQRGFTLGHYPQSLHISTVGGWVATRATGTFSSKYGGIEDRLYSLEVVMPTGEVIRTRNIARSSVGPRLSDLFVGSEGAFGIITRVTLKIHPLPEVRRFRGVAFPSMSAGLAAVRAFYRTHLVPAVIRLYEEQEAANLFNAVGLAPGRPLLLIGIEGSVAHAEFEEKQLLALCADHGGEDVGAPIGNQWEQHRYNAEWLDVGNAGAGRMADAIDVAANWKTCPVLYERVMAALRPLCSKLWAHYSHFTAHGGSIYFIVFIEAADREAARRQYARVWETAMELVLAHGGSIAHHHGSGLLRQPYIRRELGSELIVLERVKHALDPDGILNPGKLVK